MTYIKIGLFSHAIKKRTSIVLGVLILLFLAGMSCTADISLSFTAMNQADMSLNESSGNMALGDYLFLNDTSNVSSEEEILQRNWTVTGPVYNNTIYNVTNPVFGPFDQNGSVMVNYTITNSSGYQYPSDVRVFQVINGTKWISADFSDYAMYDNRTGEDPFGTITYQDTSVAKFYPEAEITDWWWKYTNKTGEITGNYSGVNSFILKMNPWVDTYMINLTVKNNQGDLVSTGRSNTVPPDNVHPEANFTVTPMSGYAPLYISIIDQSKSLSNYTMTDIPLGYRYTIGNMTTPDVFGEVFISKNFNVTLKNPGIYNITQNVTNVFGESDQTSIGSIEVSSPLPPDIDFSASPNSGTMPLNVSFTSIVNGVGPFSYEWNFGDNSTGIESQPVHTYNNAGIYDVILKVTGAGGSTSRPGLITVSNISPPEADFSASPRSGTVPLNVSFTSIVNGVSPYSYEWDFGDGTPIIYDKSQPDHTYNDIGVFNVTLEATGGGRSMLVTRPGFITVSATPDIIANFTALNTRGVAPFETRFIDLSAGDPDGWEWNFNDGVMAYTKSPNHTFVKPGVYNVSLQVMNSSFGASNVTYDSYITAASPSVSAGYYFNYIGGQSTRNLQFTDRSVGVGINQWNWDFADGVMSTLQNPSHMFNQSGTYNVRLTVSNGYATGKYSYLVYL